MISFDHNQPSVIQHNATGTSAFNPTVNAQVGRARRTVGTGAAAVTFRCKQYGLDGNVYTVQIIAPQGINPTTIAVFSGNKLIVKARRNASSILATADEVALVVNALDCPIKASAAGTDPVVASSELALQHGLNGTNFMNQRFIWTPEVDADPMGLIHFGQEIPLKIHQIEVALGSSVAFTVKLMNLDSGYGLISGEDTLIYGVTGTGVFLTNPFCLSPNQAIGVTAATTGVVRVTASRFTP